MTYSATTGMWRKGFVVVLAALGVLCFCSVAQAKVKRSIAVAPITSTAGAVSWVSGEAVQAQLITELTKTGRYRVVERENIKGIIGEQDMAADGRTRKGSGPKTGDIEGAQLMIKGVITDAEEESAKGGKGSFGGISLGGKKTIYRVTMDFRIYDAQTSLILSTATVTAEQVKKAKSGGIRIGGLGLSGGDSKGDTTGAIVRDLIKKALEAVDKQAKKIAWKSKVLTVKGEKVVILGGSRDGLEDGMRFKLFELGEQIVDEDTGQILDEGEETEIGEIKLVQVKEKVSYAAMITGQPAQKGNVVRLIDADTKLSNAQPQHADPSAL